MKVFDDLIRRFSLILFCYNSPTIKRYDLKDFIFIYGGAGYFIFINGGFNSALLQCIVKI